MTAEEEISSGRVFPEPYPELRSLINPEFNHPCYAAFSLFGLFDILNAVNIQDLFLVFLEN